MSSTSNPVLRSGRAGQLIAGAGATLALLGPLTPWLAGTGAFVLVLGAVVAAPVAPRPGPFLAGWWPVTAVAALLCLIGFGLGFALGWLGGLVAVGSAAVALVALTLGFPADSGE